MVFSGNDMVYTMTSMWFLSPSFQMQGSFSFLNRTALLKERSWRVPREAMRSSLPSLKAAGRPELCIA